MIENWPKAIEFVLKAEGGYTLDPRDPGGETMYGISKKSYPKLDIANLTIEQAQNIYKIDYWNRCKCDALPAGYDIAVMDMAVNQGVVTAIKCLQKTVGVDADGIIGPKTIEACFKKSPRSLRLFLAERLSAYARLMHAKPDLFVFANNWNFRVITLSELILK